MPMRNSEQCQPKQWRLSSIFLGLAIGCVVAVFLGASLEREAMRLGDMGMALLTVHACRKWVW